MDNHSLDHSLDHSRPAEILLVEDNDNDVELTRLGFQRAKLVVNLHRTADGEQCMAFLRKQGEYAHVPTPDLILLDLNMPRMDGLELLGEIRRDPRLKDSVVFVLTTSRADEDKAAAYAQNVAGYLVKSDLGQNFAGLLELITAYCKVVELPVARA